MLWPATAWNRPALPSNNAAAEKNCIVKMVPLRLGGFWELGSLPDDDVGVVVDLWLFLEADGFLGLYLAGAFRVGHFGDFK